MTGMISGKDASCVDSVNRAHQLVVQWQVQSILFNSYPKDVRIQCPSIRNSAKLYKWLVLLLTH